LNLLGGKIILFLNGEFFDEIHKKGYIIAIHFIVREQTNGKRQQVFSRCFGVCADVSLEK